MLIRIRISDPLQKGGWEIYEICGNRMKTNTKIIMALGVLAAFMMVAVPFVAVSDDASADDTPGIIEADGLKFDFTGEVDYGDYGKLNVSDLGTLSVSYDNTNKTFIFTGDLKKQDLDATDGAFYKMWTGNTEKPYGIAFQITVPSVGDKIEIGLDDKGTITATESREVDQFLLYLTGDILKAENVLKYTLDSTGGGSASVEYTFDLSKVKTEESVAKVTDKDGELVAYCADFITAVELATNDQTVTLLKNADVTGDVTVSNVITIDLNKNKVFFNKARLTVNGELTLTNGTFESKAPVKEPVAISVMGESSKIAKLTLENVEIISAEAKSSGEYSGYGIFAAKYSTVTVNEGTKITADYAAISGNGTTDASSPNYGHDANIIINGGTFESRKATCIYFPNTSTLIVRGGTFTGASGFEIRAGTNVNISGATINVENGGALSNASSTSISGSGSFYSPLGAAFAIVCSENYCKNGDVNVTIGKNTLNLADDCYPLYIGNAISGEGTYLKPVHVSSSPVATGKESMTINYNLNESENFTIVQSTGKMPSMLIDKDGKIVACSDKITGLSGTITLDTDKDVTLSNLGDDITVKGKVKALTIIGSGDESVSIELDSAKTLCISNVKDVTVDGGTFTTDSYVKDNDGESVVNISNVKEKVSVKNVTIIAKEDVKGQGISIMNCDKVKQIVVSDNKIYNAGHHSIMIGSVFKELETLDITNNTFSGWGCNVEYSSAIHMFGEADSSVKAAISNNTFTCKMEDSSRLGKIISIGYQNGNNVGDSMGAFNNPVLFTKNVVNGKATDDFSLVVEKDATTYVDFGTKYAGKAISSVGQNGINHKAISYGDFTIVSTDGKMMDIGEEGSIVINGTVTCEGIIKITDTKKIVAKPGTLIMMPGSELKVVNDGSTVDVIGTNGGVNVKSGSISINTIGSDANVGFGAVIDGVSEVKALSVWENDKLIVNKDAELKVTGVLNVFQTEKLIVNGKITITGDGKLTVKDQSIVGKDSAFVLDSGASVAINTNANGGYDAILSGKATSTGYTIKAKDTLTIANGAELKMTGDLTIIGKLIVDGTLDLGRSKLILEDTTTVDVKGKITGGEIDITNIAKGVKCITVNVNGVLNTTVDGTVAGGANSIIVLNNIVAGANGITVKKGSVIVDGIIKTGDVTIPAGSTSFVYGTLESGSTLTIEPTASVNPETTGHSGTLVVESGASVVSEGAIVSVIYKAGSSYNGEEFSKDTKITPSGEVKVSIRIYLNYDSNKLMVSAHYVDAFAGDKYGDLLSDVYVEGVNKRITFTGWYNTLNEKIVSGAIVPDVTEDIILSAHFDEVAKQIPAKVDSDNGNDVNDYSLVIAIIVLVASLGFLAYVIKKR